MLIFSAYDDAKTTDDPQPAEETNTEMESGRWDITGSIFFHISSYNSPKPSMTHRNFTCSKRRDSYQCAGLSTYDLQLIFQLLLPLYKNTK